MLTEASHAGPSAKLLSRDSLSVAHLYPYWQRLPDTPITNAMSVIGTELTAALARIDVDVATFSTGERFRHRSQSVGGVEHRWVPTAPDALLTRARALRTNHRRPRDAPETIPARFAAGYAAQAGAQLRRHGTDVAHIHIFDSLVPFVRKISPRTKIVLHLHDHKQTYREDPHLEERLEQVDRVVACSEFLHQAFVERWPRFSPVATSIWNGVDMEAASAAAEPEADSTGIRILFIGRVSPEKGVHVLLEAFEQVARHIEDIELVIVGPTDIPGFREVAPPDQTRPIHAYQDFYQHRGRYARFVDDLASRIGDRVVRVDAAPHAAVAGILRSADVFAFPSIWDEPFGLPVIEAAAAGVPAVGSSIGGIRETIVDGETGLLTPPGSAADLAEALLTLATDPDLRRRLGGAARDRAAEQFGLDRVAPRWKALYEETVAES